MITLQNDELQNPIIYLPFHQTVNAKISKLNPGAPGAGSSCHFRLSSLILRETEVIATHGFFQK